MGVVEVFSKKTGIATIGPASYATQHTVVKALAQEFKSHQFVSSAR